MTKDKWVHMPHAGHLIVGDKCQFHLNTYVGGYIVSTVGEYWPERSSREIHASIFDPAWHGANNHLKGDVYDAAYMERFGFEDLGYERKYETMVFKAGKSKDLCCPFSATDWSSIDFNIYKDAGDARKGHEKLCKKWAAKK